MEKFSIENWARCYKHTSKIWNEICSHSNCSFACFSNAMSYSLNRIICVWKRFYMENNVENMQTLRWVFEKCRITEYERENWHCLTCSWHSLAFENPFVIGLLKLKELHFSSGNPIDFFLCVCASELARTKSNHTDLSYDNDRCVIAHFHWNKFKLCGLIKTISMLMQWWERFKMQIQGIVKKRAGIFSNNGLPCTLMKIVWPSQRFPFIRKFSSIVVICWRAHF